jgi:hypothetical protein
MRHRKDRNNRGGGLRASDRGAGKRKAGSLFLGGG